MDYTQNFLWSLPFAGLLLSIALLQPLFPRFWHHHYGKIALSWALAFICPFMMQYGSETLLNKLAHVIVEEYIPFTILITGLYVVAGGIRLKGTLVGTPLLNTGFLALGTVLASLMGTTGAAMLLIRPLIHANKHRLHSVHTFVFFIFLVANIGGSLTPIGDPPLFLGFLMGVPFSWPFFHLGLPMLFLSVLLLLIYAVIETMMYRKEPRQHVQEFNQTHIRLQLQGGYNFFCLMGIIAAVVQSGLWQKPDADIHILHATLTLPALLRDGLIILIAFISWRITPARLYIKNGFSWEPVREVAKLFAAIFICMIPMMATLKAGSAGALSFIPPLLALPDGSHNPMAYFWFTGVLSSFLDNAPTYLVFFQSAGGDAALLTTQHAQTLIAISMGAVFMGAMTYIGNAPNFMVRAIVVDSGLKMPSFLGYIGWSAAILLPALALIAWWMF